MNDLSPEIKINPKRLKKGQELADLIDDVAQKNTELSGLADAAKLLIMAQKRVHAGESERKVVLETIRDLHLKKGRGGTGILRGK